jgi:amidase
MAGFGAVLGFTRSVITGAVVGRTDATALRLRPLDFTPFDAALAGMGDAREAELAALVDNESIAGLGALLDAGRITATELALLHLRRIRRRDDELGSIIELNPQALAEAAASDRRRAAGSALSELDGITVTLKDNIETGAPLHTTGGAVVLAGHVATADAPIVAALRRAGAVVLGKNNLSELAGATCRVPGFSAVGGQTVNPYGAGFTPGGSSSGSAVAVAAGFSAVSVGTETSGSLIAPAAFNGVVALKPGCGVLDGDGIIPLVSFQDTPGPVARSVADAAALLRCLGGPAAGLRPDALDGVVAGVLAADILGQGPGLEDPADNPALLERLRTALAAAGARVVDAVVTGPEPRAGFEGGFLDVVLNGLAHDTVGYLARAGAPVTTLAGLADYNLASPRQRMPKGQLLLAMALLRQVDRATYEARALDFRRRALAFCDATFEAAGADVLVSFANLHSAFYATAGLPAVTVPLGVRGNGMPAGATLIGRSGDDARLLGFAHALEGALGRPTPVPLAGTPEAAK